MPREDWRDYEGERERRRGSDPSDRNDFGQADYSDDYAYDPRTRSGVRAGDPSRARNGDFGQADYLTDWSPEDRRDQSYRGFSDEDQRQGRQGADERDDRHESAGRSWREKAGAFFGGGGGQGGERRREEEDRRYEAARHGFDPRHEEERRQDENRRDQDHRYEADRGREEQRRSRRRGPSDRVLWAVIMERLEDERRIDLRDVDVTVEDGEVTLNGTVRRKSDRRLIEDIADVQGVQHVQNNLRVRDRGWTFL
jgi:hypothetical protein